MIKRGSTKEVGFGLELKYGCMSIGTNKRRTTSRPSIMEILVWISSLLWLPHREDSASHESSVLSSVPPHPFPTMLILLKDKTIWFTCLNPQWLLPTGYNANSQKQPKSFWDWIPTKSQLHNLHLPDLFSHSSNIQTPKSPKGSHICLLNKFGINSLAEAAPSNASCTLFAWVISTSPG